MLEKTILIQTIGDLLRQERNGQPNAAIMPAVRLLEGMGDATFFEQVAQLRQSFLMVYQLSRPAAEPRQLQQWVRELLPALLHVCYYRSFGRCVLLLQGAEQNVVEPLCKAFAGYGIHKLQIGCLNTRGEVRFLACGQSGASPVTEAGDADSWKVLDGVSMPQPPIAQGGLEEERQQLREANFLLQEQLSVLKKNIYDLNNYYRYVRGETTFNYHNRKEEQQEAPAAAEPSAQPSAPTPEELTVLVNSTAPHPHSNLKEAHLKHYNEVYERLPRIYKKLGSFLKVVSGKRDLMYYLSGRHKKAFLEFVASLPEDKQVEAWYYYEYEILPGWYKSLGRRMKRG